MSVSPVDWIPLLTQLHDPTDAALKKLAQDEKARATVNDEFIHDGVFYGSLLEFAIKQSVHPSRIVFLLDVCGTEMWDNILEQDTFFQTREILHKRGARFKLAGSCFRHACGLYTYRNVERAITFMVQYPQFWDTNPRKCELFEDGNYELTEKIIDIAHHRGERARKARMAMLSLTYGGTKHLSKDMLRLVIGHMKNPNYVANPVWGTPWRRHVDEFVSILRIDANTLWHLMISVLRSVVNALWLLVDL
jgi:hypothetical protein